MGYYVWDILRLRNDILKANPRRRWYCVRIEPLVAWCMGTHPLFGDRSEQPWCDAGGPPSWASEQRSVKFLRKLSAIHCLSLLVEWYAPASDQNVIIL